MPLYEFKCTVCGEEETHRMPMHMSDIKELDCRKCGELSTKQVSLSGFELKGGGWFGSGYTKSE